MNKGIASLLFLCLALIQPSVALAQTTNDIEVQLEGCEDVRHASIILHGEDKATLPLTLAADGLWKAHRLLSFKVSQTTASLRLYPGRTTCRRPLADQTDKQGNAIARFVFQCVGADYRRIEFYTGDVSIAYKRHLDQSADRGDVECNERGEFRSGHGTITDVDASSEQIFIYPGMASANVSGPGILVSNLAKTRHALFVKKFSRAELGDLFVRQLATGNAAGPPVLSDNWRLRMQMRLEKLGVNDVSVSVRR
ncbi:MAG: hypothetical protein QOI24_4686 [Acidobacteriota bacterium]|jgi:hypothetical protein|nr:hypothetical protein [Acidobacteriota bacterium]